MDMFNLQTIDFAHFHHRELYNRRSTRLAIKQAKKMIDHAFSEEGVHWRAYHFYELAKDRIRTYKEANDDEKCYIAQKKADAQLYHYHHLCMQLLEIWADLPGIPDYFGKKQAAMEMSFDGYFYLPNAPQHSQSP